MTEITEDTPMMTPRSVRNDLSLFVRNASSAMLTLSRAFMALRNYS
jgi:hypothetical protein